MKTSGNHFGLAVGP